MSRNIVIRIENCDIKVYCDRDRIERVLVNLLHNAIKYSNDKNSVSVSAKELSDTVEISVIDNGRGIAAENLKTVFERFKQSDVTDVREKQESGSGLAICKAIVEAHSGSIGVESRPGTGSRFWFMLPRN